jgi:hypothetical protein
MAKTILDNLLWLIPLLLGMLGGWMAYMKYLTERTKQKNFEQEEITRRVVLLAKENDMIKEARMKEIEMMAEYMESVIKQKRKDMFPESPDTK